MVWVSLIFSVVFRLFLVFSVPIAPDEAHLILDAQDLSQNGLTLTRIFFTDTSSFTVRGFLVPLLFSLILNQYNSIIALRLFTFVFSYIGSFFAFLLFKKMSDENTAKWVLAMMLVDPLSGIWLSIYALSDGIFCVFLWASAYVLWKGHIQDSQKLKILAVVIGGLSITIRLAGILILSFIFGWLILNMILNGIKKSNMKPILVPFILIGFALIFSGIIEKVIDSASVIFPDGITYDTIVSGGANYMVNVLFRWNDFALPSLLIPVAYILLAYVLVRVIVSINRSEVAFMFLLIIVNISIYLIIPMPTFWVFRYLSTVLLYAGFFLLYSSLVGKPPIRKVNMFSFRIISRVTNRLTHKKVGITLVLGLLVLSVPLGGSRISHYEAGGDAAHWLRERNPSESVISNIGDLLFAYGCQQEIINLDKYELRHRNLFFETIDQLNISIVILSAVSESFPNRTKFMDTLWVNDKIIIQPILLATFDDGHSIIHAFGFITYKSF